MTQHPIVKIHIAGADPITCELYPEKAPITVANFLKLAEEGYYDGLIFHRIIKDFVIQGGGHDVYFKEREHEGTIKGEFADNGWSQNDIKHVRGVISMARAMNPDSASTQFFIMHGDNDYLDGKYAAFGRVIDGMETVDKIADQPTARFGADYDVPLTLVIIERVEICEPKEA